MRVAFNWEISQKLKVKALTENHVGIPAFYGYFHLLYEICVRRHA
jgi:hypothetical protein